MIDRWMNWKARLTWKNQAKASSGGEVLWSRPLGEFAFRLWFAPRNSQRVCVDHGNDHKFRATFISTLEQQ